MKGEQLTAFVISPKAGRLASAFLLSRSSTEARFFPGTGSSDLTGPTTFLVGAFMPPLVRVEMTLRVCGISTICVLKIFQDLLRSEKG